MVLLYGLALRIEVRIPMNIMFDFQKFSQVPSRQRIKEGTGLGLSICKVIIENMEVG